MYNWDLWLYLRQSILAMNKEKDIVYFVSFCVEAYKMHIGQNGEAVVNLFEKCGVVDYLVRFYDVLHTQSKQWIVEDIDEFIAKRKEGEV